MFHYDLGRGAGQRPSTGLFIYAHPKSPTEKNYNKETLAILEIKKGQAIVEAQAIGTGYIPNHKVKRNFLDYYKEYVENNKRQGSRHLICCFTKFKKYVRREFVSPVEVTYDFCFRFRRYLLDCLTGETPQNYYATFKNMVKYDMSRVIVLYLIVKSIITKGNFAFDQTIGNDFIQEKGKIFIRARKNLL